MGNSCSRIQDPCVIASVQLSKGKLPVCGNEHCGNILPLIDEESVDEYPGCQSTYLLDQTVNITSPNITGFETEGAINGSVLSFQAPNSLDMLSLIGLLSHKAASSPLVITDGNAMLHTSAETGRSQQADANPMKKPHAELQLYIVTWNMNGRLHEPEKNLSLLLGLDGPKRYDLYVIGLQEAPKFSGEEAIGKLLGDMYCCVGLSLMLSLQLYIFAKKSLRQYITGTMADKVGVGGLGHVVGRQKGAAAVLLAYNKVSLLFITSHLARGFLKGSIRANRRKAPLDHNQA